MTKNKKNLAIALLALAVVVLLALLAVLLLNRTSETKSGTPSGIVIQEGTVDWTETLPNTSGGQEGIKLPGYGEITVLKGSDTMKITLVNPEGNPCYFRYWFELPDSGDILYQSDLIEPGKAVQEIPLEHLPGVGDYTLYIHIDTYALEDGTTAMNGGVVNTVLHVI